MTGRRARSAIAAAATIALACVAHAAGDGSLPSVAVLLPVTAAVVVVARSLADRRLPRHTILALLGSAQILIHLMGSYVGGAHEHAAAEPALMIGMHAAATVVTALLLAHADRIWWQVRAFAERRHTPVIHAAPVPAAASRRVTRYAFVLLPSLEVGDVGVRGPPRPVPSCSAA